MSQIEKIKERAKALNKTVVLPETNDIRVLKAARSATDEGVAKIILIGDAEPHPKPRGIGKYSEEYVINLIKAKNISLKAILLPSD